MIENPNSTAIASTVTSSTAPPSARRHDGLVWRCAALACTVLMIGALVGCSSTKESTSSTSSTSSTTSDSTSTTYPADKQQVCQARDQLQTSVKSLTEPATLTKGATVIKASVTQVQTDVESLKTAAKQDYQPQIDALQTSLQDLQTAAGNLGNGSLGENMTAVGTAITAVGDSASALFTQLKTSCG